VENTLEDAFVDQSLEPVGEDVAGDPEALLDLVEPGEAEERVANDGVRTEPHPSTLRRLPTRPRHLCRGGW
jgi:hypothetical protein